LEDIKRALNELQIHFSEAGVYAYWAIEARLDPGW
jgi:hypothetical protein